MFYILSIERFLVTLVRLRLLILFSSGIYLLSRKIVLFRGIFMFDRLSFYTLLLVIFLGVFGLVSFHSSVGGKEVKIFLFISLLFTILCFCANNVILFWCFYELRMLPLIYLIYKESPYSERFLAGWYFSGYLLVTSLPLILILIYISMIQKVFLFSDWIADERVRLFVYITLSIIFFTKVPLIPFHTWLPIVHAEATSIVSIFLSGYIMKLGLLGVYRSSYVVFYDGLWIYLFGCLVACGYFFFVAVSELDGKRWLAFLSLSHIVVPFLGFFVCDMEYIVFVYLYCLGHGLGAGIVFGLLWWFYEVCNSRNWLLIKSRVNNNTVFILIVCLCLLTLCSFPITINFFCEVKLVCMSLTSMLNILFWSVYLFLGGLVPLVLCGHLLIRCEFISKVIGGYFCWFRFLIYLCIWCYFGIICF